jgi:hypothetical protein
MRSPLMDEVGDLDPARHVRAPGTPRDAALQDILGADRSVAVRRRRPGLMAGAAALAVVAIGVGVTWASTFVAPAAYASWTPSPTVVDAAASDHLDACPSEAATIDATGQAAPAPVPVAPVLAEVRGDYTFVVETGEGAVAECFVSVVGAEPLVYSASSTLGELAEPAPDEVVVVQSGTAAWSSAESGEGAVTSAYGRAGSDVRSVTVTLDDGEQVLASVDGGWWMVWAPGEDAFTGPAEVVLDDGTTTQVPLVVSVPVS